MDNIKYTKADAIPKLFSHCIRLSVIILFIFYLFTLLLYYLFTLYHIDTLLWLHIAKESTVKVIVVALGWSLDIRSDDTSFSLFRNTNHAHALRKIYSNIVCTSFACKFPCTWVKIRFLYLNVFIKVCYVTIDSR